MAKTDYIRQLRTGTTQLNEIIKQLVDWRDVYFDRGYGTGGAQEITVQDLNGTGITPANIAGVINLAEQLQNFRDNLPVQQNDWGSVISAVRTDV